VGGLLNARMVIEALEERRIDVGPLDSYYYDLLKKDAPEMAGKVRIIDSTRPAPIPPLVATAALDEKTLERLRASLLTVGEREELLLKGFAVPPPSDYDQLNPWTGKDLP
jgi:ABC-type phosphate/phosphonate transport system substrate-binding protein